MPLRVLWLIASPGPKMDGLIGVIPRTTRTASALALSFPLASCCIACGAVVVMYQGDSSELLLHAGGLVGFDSLGSRGRLTTKGGV